MDEILMGVDPSLTNTGIVYLRDGQACVGEIVPKTTPHTPDESAARLEYLYRGMRSSIQQVGNVTDVAFEGYSFGSMNKREAMGEAGGVLRLAALHEGCRILVIPPTAVKKFVTGKGVAQKDVMRLAIFKRWGFEHSSEHVLDAYAVAKVATSMLLMVRGEPDDLTKAQAEVVRALLNPVKKKKRKIERSRNLPIDPDSPWLGPGID
jgi:crossover junction endodeoxyribonuclease RuvC